MKKVHWIIGIIVIIIDQLIKIIVIDKNFTIIPNFLEITYTQNSGAAFGIGERKIVLVLSILIILAIIGIILYLVKNNKQINYMPFIFILSGSIANLIDRIFRGYVIDYIDVNLYNFPNFNIADIVIVIGIIYFVINILFYQIKKK